MAPYVVVLEPTVYLHGTKYSGRLDLESKFQNQANENTLTKYWFYEVNWVTIERA